MEDGWAKEVPTDENNSAQPMRLPILHGKLDKEDGEEQHLKQTIGQRGRQNSNKGDTYDSLKRVKQ